MYLFIVLAVVIGLFLLAQWFVKAPPEEAKRLVLFIAIITLLVLSIVFLKFGGVLVAAIALAIPIIRRLYAFFTTYQYLRKLKGSNKTANQQMPSASNTMTEKEAREILGVADQATEAEIKAAYHKLMQKNHPDQGGSEYIAKKLNQAKDTLLKK